MSSRRLARAGTTQAVQRRDGMPLELTSRHHPSWASARAVGDLAVAYGLLLDLTRHGGLEVAPWWARFDAFREAWCRAHGLMHPLWEQTIDWRRARDVGIDLSSSSRYRLRVQPPRVAVSAPIRR